MLTRKRPNWLQIVNNFGDANKKKLFLVMIKRDITFKLSESVYDLRNFDTKTVYKKFISNLNDQYFSKHCVCYWGLSTESKKLESNFLFSFEILQSIDEY